MRPPRLRPVLICALYGVLTVAFCAPLFARPDGLGLQDWDPHLFYYGAVLKSVVEYGQPPFWNPWYCGGNVLWQNPQVALFSPAYLLTAAMSLPLAAKVTVVLHYWVGFVGMHLLLTRVIGLTFLPVIVYMASVFTLAGAPALHLAVGHNNFLPGFYLPLQLFLFLRALKTGAIRHVLLAGAILALMVFNGGLHILPMAVASVGIFAVLAAALGREWRPIVLAMLFCAAGFLYAAPKLLPVTLFVTGNQFWDARNVTEHPDRMTTEMVLRTYLDPYQTRGLKFDLQRYGWWEYGNYIGLLALLLIVASVLWIFWCRASDRWLGLSLALTTLFLLVFSAGEFSRLAPASLAAHVPLFSSFRIPSRYTIVFVLFAAVTVGWALQALAAEAALTGRVRVFVTIVCLCASLDLMVRNRAQLEGAFRQAPIDTKFRLLGGPQQLVTDRESSPYDSGSPMFRALMSDQSFYQCYEGLQLVHTADADHALVFTDDKSKIFATRFTPNRVEFSVVGGSEPSRIVLNQNFSAGWSSTLGPLTADPKSGKPSVSLARGQAGKFAFRFVPPGLVLGTALFVLAFGVSAVVWNRQLGGRI